MAAALYAVQSEHGPLVDECWAGGRHPHPRGVSREGPWRRAAPRAVAVRVGGGRGRGSGGVRSGGHRQFHGQGGYFGGGDAEREGRLSQSPTPSKAFEILLAGNRRFVDDSAEHPNQDVARRTEFAPAQRPFAVLLGCSDSRLAAEIIFDRGLSDLFVVRTAGQRDRACCRAGRGMRAEEPLPSAECSRRRSDRSRRTPRRRCSVSW